MAAHHGAAYSHDMQTPTSHKHIDFTLQPGETLLWTGRPTPQAEAQLRAVNEPVRLCIFGFAAILVLASVFAGAFPIFGLFMFVVFIPATFIYVRALQRWRRVRATPQGMAYALTDRRALIRDNAEYLPVRAFGWDAIRAATLCRCPYDGDDVESLPMKAPAQ
jgi:hypothetical protein